MEFGNLLLRLSEFTIQSSNLFSTQAEINMVSRFTNSQKKFARDILYVCEYDELQDMRDEFGINVLCTSNQAMQPIDELKHLNLVFIDTDFSADELVLKISEELSIYHKVNQAKIKLSEALISGMGLQHIADVLTEILLNPLMVCSIGFKVLANSSKYKKVNDDSWQSMIDNGYLSNDEIKKGDSLGINESVFSSSEPVVFGLDSYQYRAMIQRVELNRKNVAFISIMEYNTEFEPYQTKILHYASKIISFELQRDSFIPYTKGQMYEYFFADLLDGKIQDANTIKERMKFFHLDIKDVYYILSFKIQTQADLGLKLTYIRDLLENKIYRGYSIIYENKIVMLLSRKSKRVSVSDELNLYFDFFVNSNLQVGISRPHSKVECIRDAYLQSSKAIDLGMKINSKERIFNIEDYVQYQLLDSVSGTKDFENFCSIKIFELIHYDKINNTEFLVDLDVYLSNSCNAIKSAKILNIHRSTMDYRINKIQEILDLHLEDSEVIFSLGFSLRLLKLSFGEEFIKHYKTANL